MRDKLRLAALVARAEVHASLIESVASLLEADGVGLDPDQGHVRHLRRMAGALRAQAALGKVPETYVATGYLGSSTHSSPREPLH